MRQTANSQIEWGSRKRLFLGALIFAAVIWWTAGDAAGQSTCADPTRTEFASGTSACRVHDAEQGACLAAWAQTRQTGQAVSCFFRPAGTVSITSRCEGCGPENQAAHACINTCAGIPPAVGVPATRPVALVALGAGLLLMGAWLVRRAFARFR